MLKGTSAVGCRESCPPHVFDIQDPQVYVCVEGQMARGGENVAWERVVSIKGGGKWRGCSASFGT